MAVVLYYSGMKDAQGGHLIPAVQKLERSIELRPDPSINVQKDLLKSSKFISEDKCSEAFQICSQRLQEELSAENRKEFLTQRFNAVYFDKKNCDSETAWQDYCELTKKILLKMKKKFKRKKISIRKYQTCCSMCSQIKVKEDDFPIAIAQLDRYLKVNPNDEKARENRQFLEYQWYFKTEKYTALLEKMRNSIERIGQRMCRHSVLRA